MADKTTKTVGLELEVWRQLKQISLDRETTLSDTVEFLIKQLKEKGVEDGKTSSGSNDKDAH